MHDDISNRRTAWQQLKRHSLSVETIRQVDRTAIERFHMNSLVLMENAAIGCAQWIIQQFPHAVNVLVMCGRGNNGGDGLAIARHLLLAGYRCHVVQLGPLDKLSPDAMANWRILNARDTTHCSVLDDRNLPEQLSEIAEKFEPADLIVDALLGSGAQGAPRSPMSELIELANRTAARRIAIDIPSGLDATTGQPAWPTFCAHDTLTFVARKVGFDMPTAKDVLGRVEVLPIGIPVELIRELLGDVEAVGN